MTETNPPSALEGLKVVEVAEGVSAPYCGKLLADLGAEVIKVERPGAGDPARHVPPFYADRPSPDTGLLFSFLNTSKLGVTLDVDAPAGFDLLDRLLADADVLLVSGRPSEIRSRGLDYESLRGRHSELVATYVTPFGLTGPRAEWKGGELVAFHMSGLGLVTPRERLRSPEKRALKAGGNQALMVAGLTAAVATLHALFARDASGGGRLVDVSEVEPLASFQFLNVARWTYVGDPGARGYGEGSRRVWCRDGAIAFLLFFGQTHQWDAFREVIGNPPWADAPSIRELPDPDAFWGHLNEWAGGHDKEEVYRAMQARRVPLFPENSVAEAVDSEQVRSRGFIRPMPLASGGAAGAPAAPYVMSATPARPRGPAPTLGQDNDAVYRGRLGLTETELREAYADGIV